AALEGQPRRLHAGVIRVPPLLRVVCLGHSSLVPHHRLRHCLSSLHLVVTRTTTSINRTWQPTLPVRTTAHSVAHLPTTADVPPRRPNAAHRHVRAYFKPLPPRRNR